MRGASSWVSPDPAPWAGREGSALVSPRKSTASLRIERLEPGVRRPRSDQVAVEEPLEMRVEFVRQGRRQTRRVSVTMRTPGQDFELTAGFLFSEGILQDRSHIREIAFCQNEGPQEFNVVSVRLRDTTSFDPDLLSRNFYTTSSCGVCGKASLEAVEVRGCEPLASEAPIVDAAVLAGLPDALLEEQSGFKRTGGLHAAGLFDPDGNLICLREDVGRHNAVDKIVGKAFLAGDLPLDDRVLVVSGRTSFEILQKALSAGIAMVVAVGAPSSLAVDMAKRFNMTLAGFTKGQRFNLYAGGERVSDWRGEEG